MTEPFQWGRLLWGEGFPFSYAGEILLRSATMFTIMLLFFRLSGKKQIKQFNIYDVILIVGLGSAAGDPMFYEDVPLLHALLVFAAIFCLYRLATWLTQHSHRLDVWLEGDTRRVFADNRIDNPQLQKEGLANEELYMALRRDRVSQLGQVERVYMEASGNFSIFFREDAAVTEGLPILPEELASGKKHIPESGIYSCIHCGTTCHFEQPDAHPICPHCGHELWIPSSRRHRIT